MPITLTLDEWHMMWFVIGTVLFAMFLHCTPNLFALAKAVLFSNDAAIAYPRSAIGGFLGRVFAVIGVMHLPYLFPHLFEELIFVDFPCLETVFTKGTTAQHLIFVTAPVGVAVYKMCKSLYLSWKNHLQKLKPIEPFTRTSSFLTEQVRLEGTMPTRDMDEESYFEALYNCRWVPKDMNIVNTIERSASYYGMTFWSYLFTDLTVGFEYRINTLVRIFKAYGHVGRFASRKTTREQFYNAMVNTSMICWMKYKTGHLVFENLRLPFQDTSVIDVKYIKIELDHVNKKFLRLTIVMKDDSLDEHIVGDEDKTGDNIEEAVVIANAVVSLYAHIHVHWWANGTAQLIKNKTKNPADEWSLANKSNNVTQWMNNAATYGSYGGIGVGSPAVMADILSHNGSQGLPIHHCPKSAPTPAPAPTPKKGSKKAKKNSDSPPGAAPSSPTAEQKNRHHFMNLAAGNSKAHKMVMEARAMLKKKRPNWTTEVTNSFLASTLMHSADHYYGDKYMSFSFWSDILRHDISFLRLAFFGPNTYYSRWLKCKENPQDDLAMELYEIARSHDKEFAEELFIACAN